jgi:hypothetical protein
MTTTFFQEGRNVSEFVLTEEEGYLSRDNVIIGASQTIVPGQILGQLTGGDKSAAALLAVANPPTGAEAPMGIALYPAMTGVGETMEIAVISRLAEVNGLRLVYFTGATTNQQEAINALLAARNIIVR